MIRQGGGWRPTQKGIIIYDPGNNSVTLPFPNDSVQQEKVSDENLILYCDKDGMTWSGFFSRKGIYQIIPFSPPVRGYMGDAQQVMGPSNNNVINFVNAGQGALWMGSTDGIKVFDPHTGFLNLIRAKDLQGIKGGGNSLLVLNVDTIGKKAWIYIDYDEPYYEMDIASRKCSPVLYEDSNGNRVIYPWSVLAHHPQTGTQAYKTGFS